MRTSHPSLWSLPVVIGLICLICLICLWSPATTAEEPSLPESLPPLAEQLLQVPGAPPVRAFAQGRIRGELDDSRDFARVEDTSVGATITGRVGVEASASAARAIVVVGDGGRVGQQVRTPTLVSRPVAPALVQVELALDVSLFGFPGVVAFGRAPLVVADGRWVGAEPWDARGRSLDGARAMVHGERWDALAAAIWLGPLGIDDSAANDAPSGLLVLSGRARPVEDTIIDLYAFVHRDARDRDLPLTIPTAGARASHRLDPLPVLGIDVGVGADVQGPITDQRSADLFAGRSGHAEASVRVSSSLSSISHVAPDPFVQAAFELTGGDRVGGRSWRAPAPTQHGALGLFDFFAADNTYNGALVLGGTTEGGLLMEGGARVVGLLDALGPFVDPAGVPVRGRAIGTGLALVEGAARLEVPLRTGASLGVAYGIGVPGAVLSGDAPAQRLLLTLRFAADSDDAGSLPPLQ